MSQVEPIGVNQSELIYVNRGLFIIAFEIIICDVRYLGRVYTGCGTIIDIETRDSDEFYSQYHIDTIFGCTGEELFIIRTAVKLMQPYLEEVNHSLMKIL